MNRPWDDAMPLQNQGRRETAIMEIRFRTVRMWSARTRLQFLCELLIFLPYPGVRAHEGVLGHVGGIPAGGRSPAESFGHGPDMVRSGATAHAEILHADLDCLTREVGDLEAIAGERIERDGKGPAIGERVVARVL